MSCRKNMITCCILSTIIILGLIGIIGYTKVKNTRRLYVNTTCLVVNFTCIEQQCFACRGPQNDGYCTPYQCWGEYYSVSYSIQNGTEVISMVGLDRRYQCKQRKEVRRLEYGGKGQAK